MMIPISKFIKASKFLKISKFLKTILPLAFFLMLTGQGMAFVQENPAPVDVSSNVDISADDMEANLREDIVVFVGNVLVTQKDLVLKSDRITVFHQGTAGSDIKTTITRIDASGKVELKTPGEKISGTWGIYDIAENIITLGGNVVLEKDTGNIRGKRLQYNLKTGIITFDGDQKDKGRIKGQFKLPKPDKKDDNKD